MRLYFPIAKVDADRREVWGYASTEARDDQGEIVKREALQAALGDYMKFANIREMHQMSAVGVAKEANIDDKGLYIGARIVDPVAWEKVIEGVYKGFSIGGRVTQRDPQDYKTITGLVLNEISIVDRPANPQAVFDYWKASLTAPAEPIKSAGVWDCGNPVHAHHVRSAAAVCMQTAAGQENHMADPFNPPIQIWSCGDTAHMHLNKTDALKCLQKRAAATDAAKAGRFDNSSGAPGEDDEPYGNVDYADPGYQSDGKKRYPIDTEAHIRAAWNYINKPTNAGKYSADQVKRIKAKIVAAWKDKVDPYGPPSAADDSGKAACAEALCKSLWDVGHVASLIQELRWIAEGLAMEAVIEGDDSDAPKNAQAVLDQCCQFLIALVAEETSEIMSGTEVPPDAVALATHSAMHAGNYLAVLDDLIAQSQIHGKPAPLAALAMTNYEKFKTDLQAAMAAPRDLVGKVGAKHAASDQAMLDLGYHACMMAARMDDLPVDKRACMKSAAESFKAAGAQPGDWQSAVDSEAMHSGVSDSEAGAQPGQGNTTTPMSYPPAAEFCPGQNATLDSRDNAQTRAPQVDPAGTGTGSGIDHVATGAMILDLAKRMHGGHQMLMDVAHACCSKISDGITCGAAGKIGAKHSAETMGHLMAAHGHLIAAGAKCGKAVNLPPGGLPTTQGEDEGQGTKTNPGGAGTDLGEPGKDAAMNFGDLVKSLAGDVTDETVDRVTKAIKPQLDVLQAQIEKLANQPLPPLAVRSEAVLEKMLADNGLQAVSKTGEPAKMPPDQLLEQMAAEFAKMSNEEQTLWLIKQRQRYPMVVPGSGIKP
jgi:phage head maturation protease